MPQGETERRLERIEERQEAILDKLGVVAGKVDNINGSVGDLLAEVGRVPPAEMRGARLPITDRLHNIESVTAPSALQAAVHAALDQRRAATWTRSQKFVTMAGVIVGTVFAVLRFAGLGG